MKTHNKPTVEETIAKIKELQKKAKDCSDNYQAMTLQKEIVDILQASLEDKDFIMQLAILSKGDSII